MDRQRQNPLQSVLIATCLCALSACAPAPRTAAGPPSDRSTAAPGVAATHYDTAVPRGAALLDDDSRTLAKAIDSAKGRSSAQLIGDPRLLRLAGWVADHLAPDGTLPMQAALDQVARHLGLAEPTPHVVVIASSTRDDVATRLADDVASLLAEHDYSHYGAVAIERDGLGVYVVALAFRFLELAPVARAVATGSSIALVGRLTHGFSAPELAVTRPDGQVVRGTRGAGSAFDFQVASDSPGIYRVEILGESALGITVVANFPVYVGETPKDRIELGAIEAPVSDPAVAASRLLELLNRERQAIGLGALVADPKLANIAAAHNADMLAHGFVGHTSPTTGSAGQRVASAGIRTGLVLENIGRGYSLNEVHAGLLESPGHRGNLLNPQATDVGIAVSVRAEEGHYVYLVTQLFTRVTPKLQAHAATALLEAINRERGKHGQRELRSDAGLLRVAERAANSCFASPTASDAAVMDQVRAGLGELGASKAPVSALLSLAGSIAELSEIAALLEPNVSSIGIGLVQGERPDTPPNTLCAVLLLAQ
jgi:uncharacterized protein YkwD